MKTHQPNLDHEVRRLRGIEIANLYTLVGKKGIWLVPSMRENRNYRVHIFGKKYSCTCLDHEATGLKCKHIFATEFASKQKRPVGRPPKKEAPVLLVEKRKTYPQNWTAYNAGQTQNKPLFLDLLHDLCKQIEDPPMTKGRPRIPLKDSVFTAVYKVYSKDSGRRFNGDLEIAHERGFISHVPHFNSISNFLENPSSTNILTALIRESSLPFAKIEDTFAVDSTGISGSPFQRWFDVQHNGVRSEKEWVKLHLCCGVKTHIVTAVEIHDRHSHDAPILPSLIEATAKNFTIREVSGDKAYGSLSNMDAVSKHGGTPYFAFKVNATGMKGGLWDKMFHMFCFKREEYLKHYHNRSNVETVFHMIKSKFLDRVFSKKKVSMDNEVLCKVLCHNIYCVIMAMYKMGIDPNFGETGEDRIRWENVA